MKEFIENLLGQTEEAAAITAEYENRVRSMQVDHALQTAVNAAGGRNVTAIRALLDESAIRASEDIAAAAETAVAQLKRQHGYLFAVPQVYAPGTGSYQQPGYTMDELGKLSLSEYRRYRKG